MKQRSNEKRKNRNEKNKEIRKLTGSARLGRPIPRAGYGARGMRRPGQHIGYVQFARRARTSVVGLGRWMDGIGPYALVKIFYTLRRRAEAQYSLHDASSG
jgi:hypothetical protein